MTPTGTCPRGHALADDAVYCTVCWIRVEPVDPAVIAERKRRQRRIWIPLLGAGAVVLGVAVGGALGAGSGVGTEPALVAGEATTVAGASQPSPEADPAPASSSASPEPATVSAPLAATVAESTNATLEACVPAGTASVLLKGRSSTDEPWLEVAGEAVIGEQAACPDGEVTVIVTSDTDAQRWRLVLRNGDGQRVGKLTLDAPTG